MLSGSKWTRAHRNTCKLKPNIPASTERTCESGNGGKTEELRSNHFFTVLMVLQAWIIHRKCKNDWKWITYLDASIWYGGKIRTDCIGSTSQRRVCVTERWLVLLNLSTESTRGTYREQKHSENTLDTSEGMHRCGRYAICNATAEHLWLPKDALQEQVSIATDNTKN